MEFEWEEVDGQKIAIETEDKVKRSLERTRKIIQKTIEKHKIEVTNPTLSLSFPETLLEKDESVESVNAQKKKEKERKKEVEEVSFDPSKDAMPPIEYIDDSFLLKFLRASKFDEERAVSQILRYWYFRSVYLGLKEKKIERNHLNQELFEQGYYFSPNVRDIHGRRVCYLRPELINTSKYSREDYLRIMTYVLEYVTEEVEIQKKGHVLLDDAGEIGMSSIDYNLYVSFVKIVQGLFPVRLSKAIIVNQGVVFQTAYTLVSPFLSRKTKDRIELIGYEHDKLMNFFDKDNIFQKYGGNAIADPLTWDMS